MGNVQTLD